ncbi:MULTISPECIES: DMT family transporter [unclassified Dysgonomonas]|jgi:drug/metabolite transporter (DMT)-like permease|uniref:DMT family transporter n=1 Tax=unclassified Dysgonomonas TaxID=2630389 RepID=UPI0025BDCB18|nr:MULTISPECIES: DMT family transporter [unclassified Dysgonomonas]MDR2003497.1 DMT family transporter [Prevotella sp.]HMM02720.1 DMT family transporter [Dysgonomonas sp.]
MITRKKYWYHIIAIFTVIVWGTTFVSTKILIGYGLSPVEIFLYRFVLAYIGIWFFCPRTLFANSKKDELLCAAAGLTGGALYFVFENTALGITLASNVSLIVCTSPIFTALLTFLFYKKEPLRPRLITGSLVALVGMALVVFNGSFILQINPLGDMLTVLAALSWAFYGIILKQLNGRYSTLFITRKVFFYGIITMLPFSLMDSATFTPSLLINPVIASNLIFLGLIASLLCFIAWNSAVKELGVVQTSNYIYFVPLVTLLTSAIVIDEHITIVALFGSVFILLGVYVAENGFKLKFRPG